MKWKYLQVKPNNEFASSLWSLYKLHLCGPGFESLLDPNVHVDWAFIPYMMVQLFPIICQELSSEI